MDSVKERVRLSECQNNIEGIVKQGNVCVVYRLKSGDYLKIFPGLIINLFKNQQGLDVRQKIETSHPISNVPEIVVPKAIVKDDINHSDMFAYISPGVAGESLSDKVKTWLAGDNLDLHYFAERISEIEKVVKRANKSGIVFPDLPTLNNIIFDKSGMKVIDYDGLQVGRFQADSIADFYADNEMLSKPKYYNSQTRLFNTNLDKKSLMHLYFKMVFCIDLTALDNGPQCIKETAIREILERLGIDDSEMLYKLSSALDARYGYLDTRNQDNEYLGNLPFKIAENYDMVFTGEPKGTTFSRRLVKKANK